MKHISSVLVNGTNWLITGLLSLLGFSSCDKITADMYGTPHASFSIKGKVVDNEGTPIPGIQIKYAPEYSGGDRIWRDTIPETFIAGDGTFDNRFECFPTNNIRVYATDIDGPENGSFAGDSIDIKLDKNDYKGGDGSWFSGRVEKDITLQLKNKKLKE